MNKILVIEDDLVIQETICDILTTKGYDVEAASNGIEGLNMVDRKFPDLVICDIHMPHLNGFDTVARFRESQQNALIPFVFLTALTSFEHLRTGMNLGADDYITKPFDYKELLNTVERLLNKYRGFKSYCKKIHEEHLTEAINSFKLRIRSKTRHFQESMQRAKIVQQSILPDRKKIEQLIPQFGLFFSPKEAVSGDFYWIMEVDGKKLIAVGDCTGHGIPAALLTMVCTNMLSVAVEQFGLHTPKDILEKTNELVIAYMHSNNSMLNNGMDIALCAVDYDKKTVTFAGAKRPLYYMSDQLVIQPTSAAQINEYKIEKESLYRIKGSLWSIGQKETSNSITEHQIQFKEEDVMYLSSDGFCDQFGGFNGKKYNAKRFVHLLNNIKGKNPQMQEMELKQSFEEWKGTNEQTDDVTVFFVKF